MVPRPSHIGENRQDGNFVVVVPKNVGLVREQQHAKPDDNEASDARPDYFRTRGSRPGHCAISTPNTQGRKQTLNAQRPTFNAQRGEPRSEKAKHRTPNTERRTPNAEWHL